MLFTCLPNTKYIYIIEMDMVHTKSSKQNSRTFQGHLRLFQGLFPAEYNKFIMFNETN